MDESEREVEGVKPYLEFNANHAWNLRERVNIREVENNLTKVSEEILVERRRIGGVLVVPNRGDGYRGRSGQECV